MKHIKGDQPRQTGKQQKNQINEVKRPTDQMKSASRMPDENNVKRSDQRNDKFRDLMNHKLGDDVR